jgi:hypothetical protein
MEIPLITYLVSSGPQAVFKKIDPRSLFHIPEPPWSVTYKKCGKVLLKEESEHNEMRQDCSC